MEKKEEQLAEKRPIAENVDKEGKSLSIEEPQHQIASKEQEEELEYKAQKREEEHMSSPHSLLSAIPRETSPRRPLLRDLSSAEHEKKVELNYQEEEKQSKEHEHHRSLVKNKHVANIIESNHDRRVVTSPHATSNSKSTITTSQNNNNNNNSVNLTKSPPSSAREELRRILLLDGVANDWTRSPPLSMHREKGHAIHSANNTHEKGDVDFVVKCNNEGKDCALETRQTLTKPQHKFIPLRRNFASPHNVLLSPPLRPSSSSSPPSAMLEKEEEQLEEEQEQEQHNNKQQLLTLSPSNSPFPLISLLRSPLSESGKNSQLILLDHSHKLPLTRPFLYQSGKSPVARTRSLASSIAPTVVSSEASYLPSQLQITIPRNNEQTEQLMMFDLHAPLPVLTCDKAITPFFLGLS